jgi:hypothetical protein
VLFADLGLITVLNGKRALEPLEISTEYSPEANLVFPIGTEPSVFNWPVKVADKLPSL